jgi:hypothetical protein
MLISKQPKTKSIHRILNFGPLIEYGSHWINFNYFHFHKIIDTLKAYIRFGTKLFHLT